jgi:hypothetical protein
MGRIPAPWVEPIIRNGARSEIDLGQVPRRQRREEGAVEVDGNHAPPFGEAEVLDRMHDLDAGVADQDVHAAEGGDGALHGCFHLGFAGDVHHHAERLAAAGAQLCGGVLGRLLVEVGDGDGGAFAQESGGDAAADAARGAGDECGLALQQHGDLLSGCGRARGRRSRP